MTNTIALTDEQAEALENGESITIEPPKSKPKKWVPKEGSWYIGTTVQSPLQVVCNPASNNTGLYRDTKKDALKAGLAIRTHNRLLAYVAEFDRGWEADWDDDGQIKYYVYYNKFIEVWDYAYSPLDFVLSTVYMSEQCAYELVDKLNSGEVVL